MRLLDTWLFFFKNIKLVKQFKNEIFLHIKSEKEINLNK